MPSIYQNISFAAAASFRDIMNMGETVTVRGKATKELLNRVTILRAPTERFLFLPDRLNDYIAQIAESLWVIAGHDEIDWLTHYLPRAPNFSDDGKTWRAAYGPRLRSWNGKTDQLDEVRALLSSDASSRRAVMALYDPQRDFVESKDVPCNNLLIWLVRDGTLHLSVVIRSNDAMWGFSGANAFEWSVLHELMANWIGVGVGPVTFFAASFHLYQEHYDRALRVAKNFHGGSPYNFGLKSLPINLKWDELDSNLATWFQIEKEIRSNPHPEINRIEEVSDRFLRASLQSIRLYWLDKLPIAEIPDAVFSDTLAQMEECDLVAAGYDFFGRRRPGILRDIPHQTIARYFAQVASNGNSEFNSAIKQLHTNKDRAYGGAWKRRGELVSVLANIARKIDRLEVYAAHRHELVDETILDTAVDFFVYAAKYQLFLEDMQPGDLLGLSAPRPFSDHDENFNTLVDQLLGCEQSTSEDVAEMTKEISSTFEAVWPLAQSNGDITERKVLASRLTNSAAKLIRLFQQSHPQQVASFIRTASGEV